MYLGTAMEDIISLSSGSEADSDLEVVGCYSDDTKEDARPFRRVDWVPVKPVVIDLSKLRRRRPQRCQLGSIEVVDLEKDSEAFVCTALSVSDKEVVSLDQQGECQILPSLAMGTNQSLAVESSQIIEPSQKPCLPPVCVALTVSEEEGNGLPFEGESPVPLTAALNLHQNISLGDLPQIDLNQIDFTGSSVLLDGELPVLEKCSSQRDSLESIPSPFSLDSPYHCPSEIDPVLFSDESSMLDLKDTTFTTDFFDHPAESLIMPYSSADTEAQGNSALTEAQTSSALTEAQTSSALTDAQGNSALTEAQTSSALTDAQGNSALTEAQGNSAHTEAQGNSAHTEAQGNSAHPEAQGNSALTEAQGNSALTEAQGNSALTEAQGNSPHTEAQGNSAIGLASPVADLAVWEEVEQNLEPLSSGACQSDVSTLCRPPALPASDTGSTWTETQNNCTPNSPGRPVSGDSRTVQSPNPLSKVPCPQSCVSYPLPERGCHKQEVEILGTIPNGHGQVDHRHDDAGSHVMSDLGPGMSGQKPEDKQYISHLQLKKLKKQMGAFVQGPMDEDEEEEEEEEEDYGPPEVLCRQSLSLVYSTIDENYPEGTLQLLSDFLQPRYYPPPDIMAHLLRGILMDPHCPDVLALEAYTLLTRIQIFHPSDISTLPWDWGLLTAVMDQQDGTRRLRLEVRRMLLQYVLKILEDDFQRQLCLQKLHQSITKAMLSCELHFTHVRELICWLFEAVSMAVGSKDNKNQKRERNENLKMVMALQKMLVLALEVDRTPTCSANKLSQELFHTVISCPKREHRLLVLGTLESNLLKCKLLELLLDYECPQKIPVPMSFSLLLHFLQHSTLPSDPMDGSEDWRRWEELLQLIWMLLLSYEEVMKGHLRCSITERSTYSRAPTWTVNDRLTPTMVQDAVDAFLARTERDLGSSLPAHVHESLALLQGHLLDTY